ncbi:hypothetical protein [Streptomyces sp. NPDC001108]
MPQEAEPVRRPRGGRRAPVRGRRTPSACGGTSRRRPGAEDDRPLGAESFDDPFRRGLLTIARATSEAELEWLATTLERLEAV